MAVTETFRETLWLVSEAVTVMVTLPEGVELVVEAVKTAEPEPPVIEVVSKLAIMFEFVEEAVSETVPVKPFTAVTLIVYVPEAPAVMTWVVGLADNENSEFPPPLPVVEPTVRRGEITQPLFKVRKIASKNTNVRIGCSSFRWPVIRHGDNAIGLSFQVQVFARDAVKIGKEFDYFVRLGLAGCLFSSANGCFHAILAQIHRGE